jgi:hypothetical protein
VASEDESTWDTIKVLKHKEPFLTFMIILSSGDKYLIEDPDALAMGGSQLHYYPSRSDRAVHMRLNQSVAVEQFGEKQTA